LHSEHVYKNNFGVEMNVRMNHCAIFGYSYVLQTLVITAEHRPTVILRFHTNKIMLKNWSQMFHDGWASRSQPSSARFQSNCIDFSHGR